MQFTTVESILGHNYRTRGEIMQALNDLDSMYSNGNIERYQYENAKKLLEDKLKSM